MSKDLWLGKRSQAKTATPPQVNNDLSGEDDYGMWPTVVVVALIVTILASLFVFVGSLPALHEHQKNEAIRNGTLRP